MAVGRELYLEHLGLLQLATTARELLALVLQEDSPNCILVHILEAFQVILQRLSCNPTNMIHPIQMPLLTTILFPPPLTVAESSVHALVIQSHHPTPKHLLPRMHTMSSKGHDHFLLRHPYLLFPLSYNCHISHEQNL